MNEPAPPQEPSVIVNGVMEETHAPPLPPPQVSPYRGMPTAEPLPAPPPRLPFRAIAAVLAGLIAAGGITVHYAFKPPVPKAARALGARLDLAAGEVIVDGTDGRAISGTPLAVGAKISAKKGARALVRTGDGAAVFLREDTVLELREHGVELVSGEIWVDAPKSEAFAITAGKGAVSASDSGIDVKREGEALQVYVARGLAVLSTTEGRVEIGAGEQAKAAGKRPEVASVKFWNDWTGGMVDQHAASRLAGTGSGRLYGLDPSASPGAPAQKLGIAKQVVHAVVRDGIAETEVDQTFSNPGAAPIEGYYWFTVPTSATVTGFALETNGQLVEGEVIEKREAAAQYGAAMHQGNEPALLEWVDGRTYRARIFPIAASGTRRIVLRYTEMLPTVEGKTRYVYPMRSDDPVRFDELALSVDLGTEDKDVATSLDARVEADGRTVSMRRSGYTPRADFQLEMTQRKKHSPVAAWRYQGGSDQADYVMLRWSPDKDFAKQTVASADVVVVVDTSAGGDEASRQLRLAAAESTLRALSAGDHFALVALDVAPRVVYPASDLAPATEAEIGKALEKLADHGTGGATDLGAMFEPALARLHGKEQAAVVYVGDGAATSGETGAEALLERLRRSLTGSRARFFAIGTGASSSHELLSELSRVGGGQYVRIDEASQTTAQSLRLASAMKTPVITDVSLDIGAGLDQPIYSATGKLSRGEELVLLARTHHPLPQFVTVHGRLGGKDFDDKLDLKVDTSSNTAAEVPRLWAAEYARRLMGAGAEENRSQILQLGTDYGLITPFTSSLALDDESAYARQGIPRHHTRVHTVRLSENFVPAAALAGCDAKSAPAQASSTEDAQRRVGQAAPMMPQPVDIAPVPTPSPMPATPPMMKASPVTVAPTGAKTDDGDHGLAASPATADEPAPNARRPVAHSPARPSRGGGGGGGSSPPPPAKPATTPTYAAPKTPANDKALALGPAPEPVRPAVLRALALCSDLASRPLAEREILWQKRAKKANSALELATIYDNAYAACELPDWRDEAALLDILGQRIDTEQTAETFLGHLAPWPDAQRFVARNILRRTVDVRIAAAVARATRGGVDWARVDNELATTDKIDKQMTVLKAAMLAAPLDPQGDVRYVRLLSRAGQRNEAIAHGRRLRDRGFMTPTLAQSLGDVLADAGEADEAMRTYSEIVEFDGSSRNARRALGDIYLRQGWAPAAYRQYKTLTDLDAKNPLAWLRLANAAANAGRVDEALHIEREVAGGEGTPGPNDPRVFAKMLSASRLAMLLAAPDPAVPPEAVSRKLKELSLFSGPGTLELVTWDDLDARLYAGAADEKKETLAGEATDAGAVGLYARLGTGNWGAEAIRQKGDILPRAVKFRVLRLTWDGSKFGVASHDGKLEAGAKSALTAT